jgi:hypothetical protein
LGEALSEEMLTLEFIWTFGSLRRNPAICIVSTGQFSGFYQAI